MKLAIITARGGSKRIPRKNIKNFLGKPIISYSIHAALTSELFDEVMVSTDDEEIAQIARKYGAHVPFLRSKKTADDFATTYDVLEEVLLAYKMKGFMVDVACGVYPTAPFLTPDRLNESFKLLQEKKFDVVLPVLRYSFPIQRALKMENGRVSMIHPENKNLRSQDLMPTFHDAGQFYFFNVQAILEKKLLNTDNVGAIEISDMEAHDIDNPSDWEIAEFKYQWRLHNL
jgi:pseudaminic acid cytidylyltransferase